MTADLPAEIGETIGTYRLERLLGEGGMGCVYLASHVRLGRKAAIKVLRSSFAADKQYVARFFQEARVVNDVCHPNIVDVVDYIDTENPRRVASVMEYLSGDSLAVVLKKGPLSFRQSINLARQLADALSAVHRIHVVHRDLKPENIMVIAPLSSDFAERPAMKVLDFGIAKVDNPNNAYKTAFGEIVGTPAYMAPEQAYGEAVSPATDVYAFGEILFEMLTGRCLFRGEPPQIARLKVRDRPPEVVLPDGLPNKAELEVLIRRCVEPKPERRPPLEELAGRLAGMSGEGVVSAPMGPAPVSVVEPTMILPPRRRAFAGLYVAIAVAVCALGAAVYFWARPEERPVVPVAPVIEPLVEPSPAPLRVPEPEPRPVEQVEKAEPPRPKLRPAKTKKKARPRRSLRVAGGLVISVLLSMLLLPAANEAESALKTAKKLFEAQKYEDALPHFERAHALELDNVVILIALATCAHRAGKYDRAIAHYEEAKQKISDPRDLEKIEARIARVRSDRAAAAVTRVETATTPTVVVLEPPPIEPPPPPIAAGTSTTAPPMPPMPPIVVAEEPSSIFREVWFWALIGAAAVAGAAAIAVVARSEDDAFGGTLDYVAGP